MHQHRLVNAITELGKHPGCGARAVAFDLIFSERSLYATLGESDDDRDLAERIAGKPVVQSVMFTYAPPDGSETPPDRKWPDGLLSQRDASVRNGAKLLSTHLFRCSLQRRQEERPPTEARARHPKDR